MEIKDIFMVNLSKGSENTENGLGIVFGCLFSSQKS